MAGFFFMIIAKQITVIGRVQGVYFRASTVEVAQQLSVRGEVKNLPDGNVWIAAEGESERMEKFLTWCRQGPPRARVEELKIEDSPIKGYTGFGISR